MLKNLRSKLRYKSFVLTVATTCFLNCALATEIARSQDLDKRISIDVERKTLKETLDQISKQIHVGIIYSNAKGILKNQVTIHAKDQPVSKVLSELLSPLNLTYEIIGDQIVVKPDITSPRPPSQGQSEKQRFPIKGKVTDVNGLPLPGATIKIKDGVALATTDSNGEFTIANINDNAILSISFIGYQSKDISVSNNNSQNLIIQLNADASSLNEVQVIGYGTTIKRLNTGSVSTISSKEIEEQPVTNILSTLSGRMPGVFVQTTNGLPGGGTNIKIRGTGSIAAGTDPLYIIDGVPFPSSVVASNDPLGSSAINGAISPLNSINPDDIESISILKDADATSIYGSRASNGVVLITTKKGKAGKTKVDFNISNGISLVSNLPKLLNLTQYLQIRREAFKNDGLTPSSNSSDPNYAPDLAVWDTTKSTDWAKYLLGKTGHVTDVQGTISGGSQTTNFIVGGNYHTETSVLPGDNRYTRGGIHASLQHTSENGKFFFQLSTSYNADNNKLSNITSNLTSDLLLPPDFPLYDAFGNYNYSLGFNPLADISAISKTKTNNFITNTTVKYNATPDLAIKVSGGYTKIDIGQLMTYPTNSQYQGSANYTNWGDNSNNSVIIEPQIDYNKHFGKSALSILIGGTYQKSVRQSDFINASNFSSDVLLENLGSATTFAINNYTIDYKYISVFGRANYQFDDKYIINASIRRDGSSRFGPGNEFGTFGAIGAAWIFTNENWIKENLPFLSYGKLRGSYGITGNDQISDYQYLSTYGSSGYVYQNVSGIQPYRISNANFHWETTHKLEFALELGFLKDRILFDVNRFQNRTKDQLVNYAIPNVSGFNSYQANLPAVVENSGWELELTTKNVIKNNFSWTTAFNLTIPKNLLLSFQNLSTSSYANILVIGEPITRLYGYQFAGLNSVGVPLFSTQPNIPSTTPSSATDQYYTIGKGYPILYGGLSNSFTYKNWSLDIFGQFARQYSMGGFIYTPGVIGNKFAMILGRWQDPGDQTIIPKSSTSSAYASAYRLSSANYFNTSYFRIKNIAVSYNIPSDLAKKMKIQRLRIYLQGQNLFAFWNRNNPIYDPESGAGANIPPMRTLITGIQITL